jgi:hypothetical protein
MGRAPPPVEPVSASSDLKVRVVGGVMIVAGALLAKRYVLDVLRRAEHHAAKSISLSGKLVAMSWVLAAVGLVAVFGGDHMVKRVFTFDRDNLSAKQVIMLLALALPGCAIYVWLTYRLDELGYRD